MGDLHGDYANTLTILQFAGIANEQGHWIGKDTIFVQTGDVVDRGLDTIKIYELLQQLREEAPQDGGLVIPLLGNHEVMNLAGDWRYVRSEEMETFGGEKKRQEAWAVNGFIGSYLIPLNMTTKVGSNVFCHGGIHPNFAQHGVDWINDQTHASIRGYIRHGHKGDPEGVFGSHGPTWYRGYAVDPEETVCPLLDQALAYMKVDRMVVGHTVQRNGRIHTRCQGKVILIDIGISFVYGGHRGALEIIGDQVTALYENSIEVLSPVKEEDPSDHLEL
ncbi:Metallo-dependent phosphatase-like protein [Spinellus fusiger]|nr:Metallo-dependent phosphatase-like protein [Spinellus fusiger]